MAQISKEIYDTSVVGVFEQLAVLPSGLEQVDNILFHPFEDMLIASDGKTRVGLWDTKTLEHFNDFSNENKKEFRITSLQLINDQHISLLMTGSNDGVVRIWKNPHIKAGQEMVSAWTAIRNFHGNCDFLIDWQQSKARLLAAGSTDVIRVWDVQREMCTRDIPVGTKAGVTALVSGGQDNVAYVGTRDGTVRSFDLRQSQTMVSRSPFRCNVAKLGIQRGCGDASKLVCISGESEVFVYDIRLETKKQFLVMDGMSPDAFSLHNYANLFATGSMKQVIKLYDFNGTVLSTIRSYRGFMGKSIGPVRCIQFHPNKILFGVASQSSVSLLTAVSSSEK